MQRGCDKHGTQSPEVCQEGSRPLVGQTSTSRINDPRAHNLNAMPFEEATTVLVWKLRLWTRLQTAAYTHSPCGEHLASQGHKAARNTRVRPL
jgi:hypothetical protein